MTPRLDRHSPDFASRRRNRADASIGFATTIAREERFATTTFAYPLAAQPSLLRAASVDGRVNPGGTEFLCGDAAETVIKLTLSVQMIHCSAHRLNRGTRWSSRSCLSTGISGSSLPPHSPGMESIGSRATRSAWRSAFLLPASACCRPWGPGPPSVAR